MKEPKDLINWVELMVYIWKGFYEKQEKKLNELLK